MKWQTSPCSLSGSHNLTFCGLVVNRVPWRVCLRVHIDCTLVHLLIRGRSHLCCALSARPGKCIALTALAYLHRSGYCSQCTSASPAPPFAIDSCMQRRGCPLDTGSKQRLQEIHVAGTVSALFHLANRFGSRMNGRDIDIISASPLRMISLASEIVLIPPTSATGTFSTLLTAADSSRK